MTSPAPPTTAEVLLVEDDPGDVLLAREAFAEHHQGAQLGRRSCARLGLPVHPVTVGPTLWGAGQGLVCPALPERAVMG